MAEFLPLPLILLAALLRHFQVIRAPFFADDYLFLEQVRGKSLLGALLSPDPIGNFFRPVSRQLYFWVVSGLTGESPASFHILSLMLFLAIVTLVFLIAQRLAGSIAATVAAAFVGLHYAADVPVLWASGCQDLLAILFALCAIDSVLRGRMFVASGALALALLSKETVAFTAVIAVSLGVLFERRTIRDALRRCIPLFAVTATWAAAYLVSLGSRPAAADGVSLESQAVLWAMLHLPQVALGLEFPAGELFTFQPTWGVLGPLACAMSALAIQVWRRPQTSSGAALDEMHALPVAGVWILAGLLPVLAVGTIWSAYFYMFALTGVGLAAGVCSARAHGGALLAGLALFALVSDSAGNLREFSETRGAATARSHVNAFYVRRSMATVADYLGQMKAARPALPPRSTVFFGNVPGSLGFQTANGPLLRWAYGDSTLRSHYLTEFSLERARRGPFYLFAVIDGRLVDRTEDPMLLQSLALSMLLDDKHQAARDVLVLLRERDPADSEAAYWLSLASCGARSHRTGSGTRFITDDFLPVPLDERSAIEASLASGDSTEAIRHLLGTRLRHLTDPWPHARLAALTLNDPDHGVLGVIEAYAYHVFAPEVPDSWRKWAAAQLAQGQFEQAARSLDQYFAVGGALAQRDEEAQKVRRSLREVLAGEAPSSPGPRRD